LELTEKHLKDLVAFYEKNHRLLPWRQNRDPYRVWLSEIMLQQTRAESVIPYFERFLESFPTLQDLAKAQEQSVLKLWEGLGYYSRARNLHRAAKMIIEEYNGIFPKKREALLKLPGIGNYTAGAIASIAFDEPVAAVDGNVLRVYCRLTGEDRPIDLPAVKQEVFEKISACYPKTGAGQVTQALMELGATICLPNGKPKCEICPWQKTCTAAKDEGWKALPTRLPKRRRTEQNWTVLCLIFGKKVLLEKRPEKGLLANFYQFPMVEGFLSAQEVQAYLNRQGFETEEPEALPKAKHIFTHITWQMQGYSCKVKASANGQGKLADLAELQTVYPLPGALSVYRMAVEDLLAAGK